MLKRRLTAIKWQALWQHYGYVWVRLSLILLPAIGMLLIIRNNGVNVPYYDEFSNPFRVLTLEYADQLTSAEMTRQFNDSRKLISNVLFILFFRIFGHWNIKFQLYFTWFLGVLNILLLCLLVERTAQRSYPNYRWLSLLVLISMSALMFSFTSYYRWLWGITLHRLIPDFCIVLSAVVATLNWRNITKSLALAGCATIALFSFSGGIIISLINLAMLLTFRNIRITHILIYLSIIFIGLFNFFYDYKVRNPEPIYNFDSSQLVGDFTFIIEFLGNPFSGRHHEAFIIGLVLLIVFLFGLVWGERHQQFSQILDSQSIHTYRQALIPWIAIGGYAILCAALTAYFRSGEEIVSALDIRYILHANYLAIAVLGIMLVLITHLGHRLFFDITFKINQFKIIRINSIFIIVLIYLSISLQFIRYNLKIYPEIHQHKYRLLYGKACLQLNPYLEDISCLKSIFPNPTTPQFLEKLDRLRRLAILRPGILKLNSYKSFQTNTMIAPMAFGQVDTIQPLAGNKWRITGSALLPINLRPADAIVVVDPVRSATRQQLTIVAIGYCGLPRPDLSRQFGDYYRYGGWAVEVTPPSRSHNQLQFFAFDASQNHFFRLALSPQALTPPTLAPASP